MVLSSLGCVVDVQTELDRKFFLDCAYLWMLIMLWCCMLFGDYWIGGESLRRIWLKFALVCKSAQKPVPA